MVETPCPGCRRPVKARDDQVGRRVKCSKCGTRFHVPEDARDVLLFDDAPARPRRRGNLLRKLLAVVLLGLAAAGAVGGAVLFVQSRRPVDPDPTPAPDAAAVTPLPVETPATPAAKAAARPTEPAAAPFPNARPVAFLPPGDTPELIQKPAGAVGLDVPFAAARRVFPPQVRDADPAVLWESRAAFQSVGGQLTLGVFSGQTGGRVGGFTFDADGPNPPCDLSADGTRFAAAVGGKLTVWDVKSGAKVLDGVAPFADRPGETVAGVFFLGGRVAAVSGAGVVRLPEGPGGEFVPPAGGTAVAGRDGRNGIVAVGGTVYGVVFEPPVSGAKVFDLGPGAGRPLAVAASAGKNTAAVYETPGPQPGRFVVRVGPGGRHAVYRWPAGVGDPVSAGWCGEELLSVGTTTGAAVWFEAEGDRLRPLAVARVPGDKAIHAAAEDHWSLLPGADGKSVLVWYTMPPQGLVDPLAADDKRPAVTLRLDAAGLFR